MNDASSLHSEGELNTETQLSTDSEPIKKPPKRKIARKRPTHVRLQNHSLKAIPKLEASKDVLVVYLYNNKINNITNLDALTKLTHLYLSHNNIRRLENLTGLTNLEKLYIGHNKISVLEGLENLHRLRELHMESQRLPAGDSLTFDPRSVEAIRATLHVLNIDNNGVTSLLPLVPLPYLTDLNCTANQLSSLVDLTESLRQLPCLTRLDLKGNPVCDLQRHRDAVVESAPELRKLDELDVTPTFRQFIFGRGQAVARRMSTTKQRLALASASDDVIIRDNPASARLRSPQVALSQGNLLPPKRTPVVSQPHQTSSTHLRVGNMLTLTPEQRAIARTPDSRPQSDAHLETSSGDPENFEFPVGDLSYPVPWAGRRDTLPSSPARRPIGADARSARPSTSQQHATVDTSIVVPRRLTPWSAEERSMSRGEQRTPLRQTMSDEVPTRINMLAIMP
ncbi:protein phosphatase 1 regulatory subunit 42-like [Amphibalanus amphitrite]|uniref:protein phosphatase 1 regulatory subunit 42-like n=1 Tax=Amphibalanus amphitrite TaxID=1232801 RepID=UPI001C91F617|nr:protein phosphatase 1 regulatory subunit 42-like [Amphibalanus amphitrite]